MPSSKLNVLTSRYSKMITIINKMIVASLAREAKSSNVAVGIEISIERSLFILLMSGHDYWVYLSTWTTLIWEKISAKRLVFCYCHSVVNNRWKFCKTSRGTCSESRNHDNQRIEWLTATWKCSICDACIVVVVAALSYLANFCDERTIELTSQRTF